MPTVNDILAQRLADLEKQGSGSIAAPVAILWTDRHREWSEQVAALAGRCTVLTLGSYDPGSRTGPAVWIRCMLGRTIEEDRLLPGVVPIVYLPGIGREDLRAVEDCQDDLKPIAELQYRSVFFSHPNGRDWTVAAWLAHKNRGAGVDVAGDQESLSALSTAQKLLFEQDVDTLRGRVLRASDLLEIVNPDVTSSLLKWLDDDKTFQESRAADEWSAFVSQVKQRFGFDVEHDGALAGAELLAEREGEWAQAWSRFAEAPQKYPGLPDVLRRATPSSLLPAHPDSYPQLNEESEAQLRAELSALREVLPNEARQRIVGLENEHGPRRASVWQELGETPVADSLEHLSALCANTTSALGGATPADLASAYAAGGWRADDAYLRALGAVEAAADTLAVQSAAAAVYRPWVEASARALQNVAHVEWPAISSAAQDPGTAMIFCDGLRYDLAERLAAVLEGTRVEVELTHELAALPTVTATAKPAVTPVAGLLASGDEFTPKASETGRPATAPVLRALMEGLDWQALDVSETGDPLGRAWTEIGDVDTMGHTVGAKMAAQVEVQIRLVADRVRELLSAGWRRVVVVTDHGWLLMPDKLPKVDLPKHLADPRKGRCARLKPQADVPEATVVPWAWDPDVRIAVAPGISTFVDGKTYEHGGVSPQECVIPRITCSLASSAAVEKVEFVETRWVGLRLRVVLAGSHAGCTIDLRRKAGDPESSFVGSARTVDEQGEGALLVHDDSVLGDAAMLVVLDSAGSLVAQQLTTIGGEE